MWQDQGLYDINAASLDRVQTAEYGLDTIGLGSVAGGQNGPTLSGQNVAGVTAVSPFYMYVYPVTCLDFKLTCITGELSAWEHNQWTIQIQRTTRYLHISLHFDLKASFPV